MSEVVPGLDLAAGGWIQRRYEIGAVVGRGGLGTTFRVHDHLFGRPLALKVVRVPSETHLAALREEFERLSALSHPCLACVHDFGRLELATGELTAYYTSDWIDGVELGAFAAGRPFAALRVPLLDALSALALLHRAGLRHGDFKPGNVLVRSSGRGVLIDLSASAPLGVPQERLSGTPGFIAPELVEGATGDRRADLYAVGVTLARLLEGCEADTAVHKLAARLCRVPPAERPADVEEVLACLGVDHPEIATATPHPVRLLERDQQLGAIERLLRALTQRERHPRALAFLGEPGSGRSRLLREAKWLAQRACLAVEGDSGASSAVRDMIERASGRSLAPGPAGLLEGLDALRHATPPAVLILDDLDALPESAVREWHALAASLDDGDGVAMIWSSTPRAAPPAGVATLEVAPLSAAAVRRWAGGLLPRSRIPALMAATQGRPAALAWVLEQLAAGAATESELWSAPKLAMSASRARALGALSTAARAVLALLASSPEPLDDGELGADPHAIEELAAARLCARVETGWILARRDERHALATALDGELLRSAQQRHAERCMARMHAAEGSDRAHWAARTVEHLAASGRSDEAETVAREHAALAELRPDSWAKAAALLRPLTRSAAALCWIGRLSLSCGRPDDALEAARGALAADRAMRHDAALLGMVGEALLERGKPVRARVWLARAARTGLPRGDEARARVLAALARVHIVRGAYQEALNLCREALAGTEGDPARAALLENAGIAHSYLAESSEARACLSEAAELHRVAGHPRAQLRALSHFAFVEFRDGRAPAAVDAYRRALAIAERFDVRDRIANIAGSLGAALHQLGRWAEALQHYERGLRTAVVLGERSQQIMLGFNVAKLYADIGLFDRARREAERVVMLGEQEKLAFFVAGAVAVRGEIALAEGRPEEAAAAFERAAALFAAEGAKREQLELELQRGEALLSLGRADDARRAMQGVVGELRALDARDVEARACLVEGRLSAAQREPRARELLERARRLALEADQGALAAEVELALAHLWEQDGAVQLAAEMRASARARWERVAVDLSEPHREAFWAHPLRRGLAAAAPPDSAHATRPELLDKLRRLIDINKKLNASLDVDEVLRVAMDAAIELTGAERGFVILSADGRLSVPLARNIDREQVGKRSLKFSHSIAHQVIESGDPVVTIDAGRDERFSGNDSVHLMRLKSIACVPIRNRGKTLGALYLDNRFRRGTFHESDVELLLAFADQVGIALGNARLHSELEARTRELVAERRRVEQLMKSQAAEIDRLAGEVREKQSALEHRYDYSSIVGRGERMQQVLAMLDRVIATSVTVLIQGESGTGKELIARAIHFNGARKNEPFVTVNCGAVPNQLLESELFGHVRGAFTGADRDREGLFVAARGGTLFLDEIGEMPLEMQVKLLRVLQEREVRALGSTRVTPVDVRVVCATNRMLRDDVDAGRFREDLFYRISVVEVRVPALRERPEDLPILATHLLERACRAQGRPPVALKPAAMRRLLSYAWPGNVRELDNVLTSALLMTSDGAIGPEAVQLPRAAPRRPTGARSRAQFRQEERERIVQALATHRWNVSEVARALGIPRSTLYRKLERYGLGERS